MSWLYRNLARPFLFAQDSEAVHDRTLGLLARASRCTGSRKLAHALFETAPLPVEALGLRFPNPVGLAAGMDKQGVAVPMWEALGFGFSELGGVTGRAQPGNPKPRMFRLTKDRALVNRLGFNNDGAAAASVR
ncbi:MAG: dihydroorotate dehydrogenase (quinone), partial [Verrucomicrobiota bacterium]